MVLTTPVERTPVKGMKRFFFFLTTCLLAVALTACVSGADPSRLPQVNTKDREDSLTSLARLNRASTIVLKKDLISWGDSWTVEADGEPLATIKGQPLYLIGDTYSMFTLSGNLMGSEGEEMRLLNARAQLFGPENEPLGSITQEVFNLLYTFTLRDEREVVKGTLKQDFSLTFQGTIKTPEGHPLWRFQRDFFSLGSRITLTREGEGPITATEALWQTVIVNEIYTSSE